MNVHLHIERLVLEGVDLDPLQRRQLQASVEAELTRLIDPRRLDAPWAAGQNMARVRGPAVQVSAAQGVDRLGHQIARSIHGGLVP